MITQDLVKELFTYDDGKLYWKVDKGHVKKGTEAGSIAKGKQTRFYVGINKKDYLVHRIIFLFFHGYLPKGIDHINGDSTDNHIENLRPANQSQNMSNSKLYKTSKSGVKGVSWCEQTQKWAAGVMLNYKRFNLGRYNTIEEAAQIVKQKRTELHKEFARNE